MLQSNSHEIIHSISADLQILFSQYKFEKVLLIAISGIDGAGKSYFSKLLSSYLSSLGIACVHLKLDLWHNLSSIRFSSHNPGENYYHNAYRFEDFFSQLVKPLVNMGSLECDLELINAYTDEKYVKHFSFHRVNMIILDGIFLLKNTYRNLYDYTVWVDCSFPTAMKRAFSRNQEHTSYNHIKYLYENIYFPAQRIHMSIDQPAGDVDRIITNDL